ncbi:hypothetical protein pb186bvf_009981 [Paramecium bursaria]
MTQSSIGAGQKDQGQLMQTLIIHHIYSWIGTQTYCSAFNQLYNQNLLGEQNQKHIIFCQENLNLNNESRQKVFLIIIVKIFNIMFFFLELSYSNIAIIYSTSQIMDTIIQLYQATFLQFPLYFSDLRDFRECIKLKISNKSITQRKILKSIIFQFVYIYHLKILLQILLLKMIQNAFSIQLSIDQMGTGTIQLDSNSTIGNLFQNVSQIPQLPYQQFDLIRQDQSSLKQLDQQSPISSVLKQGEQIRIIPLEQKIQPQNIQFNAQSAPPQSQTNNFQPPQIGNAQFTQQQQSAPPQSQTNNFQPPQIGNAQLTQQQQSAPPQSQTNNFQPPQIGQQLNQMPQPAQPFQQQQGQQGNLPPQNNFMPNTKQVPQQQFPFQQNQNLQQNPGIQPNPLLGSVNLQQGAFQPPIRAPQFQSSPQNPQINPQMGGQQFNPASFNPPPFGQQGMPSQIPPFQRNPNLGIGQINQQTITQLNEMKQKNQEINDLKSQIQDLEADLQLERTKLTKEKNNSKSIQNNLNDANHKITNLESELEEQKNQLKKLQKNFNEQQQKQKQSYEEKLINIQQEIEQLQNQQRLKEQEMVKGLGQGQDTILKDYQNQVEDLRKKNNGLKNELQELRSQQLLNQGRDQQDQRVFTLEEEKRELKYQVEKEHQNFMHELEKSKNLNQTIQQLQQQLTVGEQSIDNFQKLHRQTKQELLQSQAKVKQLESELQFQAEQNQQQKEMIQVLISNQGNQSRSDGNSAVDDINRRFQEMDEEKRRREQERKEKEYQDNLKLQKQQQDRAKQEQEKNNQVLQKTAEERKRLGAELKRKAMESRGQMEVCFIVDITQSMDPYKQQTQACIDGSVQAIKKETGRDAKWSTVGYQDFEEFKALGNKYQYHPFTQNYKDIQNFLQKLGCNGGADFAEDVRGGIKQMLDKNFLKWETSFKVAILICDAPSHGRKYNVNCGDDYPNEDLRDAIELMIKAEILFIGIIFNKHTEKMFNQIEAIYKENNRNEFFLRFDLRKIDPNQLGGELISVIKLASQEVTQTNKQESKTKGAQKAKPKNKDGAIEALCKQGNFKQFDQNAAICCENRFQVYRVELNEQSFEKNLASIDQLQEKDYQTFEEGYWDCVRTKEPFAFGMMKKVYLMKKKNDLQGHLYVIKMPLDKFYESLNEAKSECRSHLVCKNLMRKFMKDMRDAHDKKGLNHKKYPEVYYSDFLILKETEARFWIAERFFEGNFIKYNNNFGFINEVPTDLNMLAQAFTYYTFHISGFNYIINDVQGVGCYFTDPAVNTKSGNFDETDMGEEGYQMYVVNLQAKKHICQKILEIMDIEIL